MHHITSLLIIAFSYLLIRQVSSAHVIVAIHDSPSLTETAFQLLKSTLRDGPKQIGTQHIYSFITFDSTDAYLLLNLSETNRFLETMDYLQQGNSSNETAPDLTSVFALIQRHFPDGTKTVVMYLFDSLTSMQTAQEAWSKMDNKKITFVSVLVKENAKATAAATIQFLTKIAKNETKNVRVCNHITEADCTNVWNVVLIPEVKATPESVESYICRNCPIYCIARRFRFADCPQPSPCFCSTEKEITYGGGGGGDRRNGGGGGSDGGGGGGRKENDDGASKNGNKKSLSVGAILGITFCCSIIAIVFIIGIVKTCKGHPRSHPYGGTRTELARRMLLAQAMQKSYMPPMGPVGPPPPGYFPGPPMQKFDAIEAKLDSSFGAVEANLDSSVGIDDAKKSKKSS